MVFGPNSAAFAISFPLSEVSIAHSSQEERRCGGNLYVCMCVRVGVREIEGCIAPGIAHVHCLD